jgi:hypothetical protein
VTIDGSSQAKIRAGHDVRIGVGLDLADMVVEPSWPPTGSVSAARSIR